MEFRIIRTSNWFLSDWPTDPGLQEAERRVENGEVFWVINFSSLEELLQFVQKKGKIIIFPDNSIEIYES